MRGRASVARCAGPVTRPATGVLVALLLTGTAACSGASSPPAAAGTPPASTADPSAAPVPSSAPPTAGTTTPAPPVEEAAPVDTVADGRATARDDVRRNEAGEPWRLDERGSRACAHAELALRAVDDGTGDGAADLREALRLARRSTTEDLAAAARSVTGTAARSGAVALLTICTEKGYEL